MLLFNQLLHLLFKLFSFAVKRLLHRFFLFTKPVIQAGLLSYDARKCRREQRHCHYTFVQQIQKIKGTNNAREHDYILFYMSIKLPGQLLYEIGDALFILETQIFE